MAGLQPQPPLPLPIYESVEEAIFIGNVANEIGRNQDLVEAMQSAALLLNGKELPKDANVLLDLGYRRVMLAKQEDRKALQRIHMREADKGSDPLHFSWLFNYVDKVDAEMEKICRDAEYVIDGHVLPNAASYDYHPFYHKLLGDLYRYRSAHKSGDGWNEAATASMNAYKRAEVAAGGLPGNSPVRLRLAVSYSLLCGKILDDPQSAYDIIKRALAAALSSPGEMDAACKGLVEKLKSMRDEDPADWE